MQEPSSKPKKGLYRLRRTDPHERLSAKLRHFSFVAAVLFVLAAAGIVIHSLYNIQIKNGATFRQYAAQQQLLDSTIQATRGEIYDTSGITLASTSVVWTIWADPSYSTALFTSTKNDDTGGVTKTADPAALQEVSTQLTLRLLSGDGESLDSVDTSSEAYQTQYQTVYDALSKSDSAYQTLATKVNNAIKLSIEKYVTEYNKAHKRADAEQGIRKGRIYVSSTKSFQRDYPYGAFAASVLGFCDADGYGTYGLEKSYESTLAGVNGRTITLRNAYGNAIADENATTYAAKDGSNLVLSLDVNVQEVVERYLNEAIAANNVENRGAAIVMNVKTGAILAMASKPDFDPNDPLNYTANEAYLNELVHAEPELYGVYLKNEDSSYVTDANGNKVLDPEGDYSGYYRDIQWKNKTITELYYPGSVFKVITAAMGVDSGKATFNTTLNCSGAYGVAKETYHCAGKKAHGVQNLAEALRNSCNIYFIQLGQRIGSSLFYDYFDAFGFTERTGVDLPNETSFMQYYSKSRLGEVELASSAFGQAMAVTPLQVCTAISAAVNGGYLVTPHVVDKITDQNGNVIEEVGANVRRQVISESASETIRQIMEYEVADGTQGGGGRAYVAGYRQARYVRAAEHGPPQRRRLQEGRFLRRRAARQRPGDPRLRHAGRPQQRQDGLLVHSGRARRRQHHQRDRALPWHRHRRHRPQQHHRQGAEPCGQRVEQRAGLAEHQGPEAPAGRERFRPDWRGGHLPVPPCGGRGGLWHDHLPVYGYIRGQTHGGAGRFGQERGFCPADAGGGGPELRGGRGRKRPCPSAERGRRFQRPARHHRDHYLRVTPSQASRV